MTDRQLVSLLGKAGFKGESLKTAFGVAKAESGGRRDAHNPDASTGDNSYGLFQINMLGGMGPERRRLYGLSRNEDLFDPLTNAKIAFRMSGGGKNWQPWTTYTSGAYRTLADAAPIGPVRKGQRASTKTNFKLPEFEMPEMEESEFKLPDFEMPDLGLGLGLGDSGLLSEPPGFDRKGGLIDEPPSFEKPRGQRRGPAAGVVAPKPSKSKEGFLQAPMHWEGTHITDGLDLNSGKRTAVDIMASPGTQVGAPEGGTIVRHGSAQGGQALYFQSDSGHLYWMGHIEHMLPVGSKVAKGEPIAVISSDHAAPHLHIDRR